MVMRRRPHLPPEFQVLPLDLLRSQNWAVWPSKIERGFKDYPGAPAIPVPLTVALDPMSSAVDAVSQIKALGQAIRRGAVALRPVADMKGDMIRAARYAGMLDYGRPRNFPPTQAVPRDVLFGVTPQSTLTTQLLDASTYPHTTPGQMGQFLSVFNQRRRYR